jgi:hypothetical protein
MDMFCTPPADRGAHGVDNEDLGHPRLPDVSFRTRSILGNPMHIAFTPQQERLRRELRAYFGALMTPEVRAALSAEDGDDGDHGDGQAYRQVIAGAG